MTLIPRVVDAPVLDSTLTCVYCGMAYTPGTPSHGAQILTKHIKVCEKHPLRQAEAKWKAILTKHIKVCEKHPLRQAEAKCRELTAVLTEYLDHQALIDGSIAHRTDHSELRNTLRRLINEHLSRL